jgi:hypothetical protein
MDFLNDEKSNLLEQMIGNLTTSYKIYWLYGVIIEIERGKQEISFKEIVSRMITNCWYSLLKFKLHLGVVDQLYNLVIFIAYKFNIEPDIHEEELYDRLQSISDIDVNRKMAELYKYVPYRLLQPFFSSELYNQQDYKKNRITESCALKTDDVFYKIYTAENKIIVNPDWADYIIKNQAIINGWIHSKLIQFLQKNNPSVPGIPLKISAPRKRDLTSARKFWSAVIELETLVDIYTGLDLKDDNFSQHGNLSIDHFIPWSFVLHDQIWNLAPTFKHINSAKNDKLPPMDPYLDRFCHMQYVAFKTICKHTRLKKYTEDYISIDIILYKYLSKNTQVEEPSFKQAIKQAVVPLYQIAQNQGFSTWENSCFL